MRNLLQVSGFLLFFVLMAFSPLVFAHTGDGPHNGLSHGFFHPLTGLDHILAMVAVGLWAAQTGGRMIWSLPLTFVVVMGLGGLLGAVTLPTVLAEHGIVLSLLILGLIILRGGYLPRTASIVLIGLFALCHGYAHGSEMPPSVSLFPYAIGFMLATTLLHLCGISIALFLKRLGGIDWLRLSGVVIAFYGVFLFSG